MSSAIGFRTPVSPPPPDWGLPTRPAPEGFFGPIRLRTPERPFPGPGEALGMALDGSLPSLLPGFSPSQIKLDEVSTAFLAAPGGLRSRTANRASIVPAFYA